MTPHILLDLYKREYMPESYLPSKEFRRGFLEGQSFRGKYVKRLEVKFDETVKKCFKYS